MNQDDERDHAEEAHNSALMSGDPEWERRQADPYVIHHQGEMSLRLCDAQMEEWRTGFAPAMGLDEPEPGTSWRDDAYFAMARMQGVAHKLFVVPVPPYGYSAERRTETGEGWHTEFAIIDYQDGGGPHTSAVIRRGYPSYHAALRAAAAEAADETETETS